MNNAGTRPQTNYLKVVFSPGVTPDKWFGRFDERTRGWRAAGAQTDDPIRYITAQAADIAIVRLPAEGELAAIGVDESLHHVRLYEEQIGIAAPKEHPLAAFDTVQPTDLEELADEIMNYQTPPNGEIDIAAVREALMVVAANVGLCIAPRPLLRAINQRGVVHRDLLDAPAEIGRTRVALVWLKEHDSEVIQDFVGICRGRSAESGRQKLSKRRPKPKRS